MITGGTLIKRIPGALSTSIDNEAVILGIESGNYFGFNEIGTEIWEKIEFSISVDKLIANFTTAYSNENQEIKNDIIDFLSKLLDSGLIEIMDEDNSGKH